MEGQEGQAKGEEVERRRYGLRSVGVFRFFNSVKAEPICRYTALCFRCSSPSVPVTYAGFVPLCMDLYYNFSYLDIQDIRAVDHQILVTVELRTNCTVLCQSDKTRRNCKMSHSIGSMYITMYSPRAVCAVRNAYRGHCRRTTNIRHETSSSFESRVEWSS